MDHVIHVYDMSLCPSSSKTTSGPLSSLHGCAHRLDCWAQAWLIGGPHTPVQRGELWGLAGPTQRTLGTEGLAPPCRPEQRPGAREQAPSPQQVLAQDAQWGCPTICSLDTSQGGWGWGSRGLGPSQMWERGGARGRGTPTAPWAYLKEVGGPRRRTQHKRAQPWACAEGKQRPGSWVWTRAGRAGGSEPPDMPACRLWLSGRSRKLECSVSVLEGVSTHLDLGAQGHSAGVQTVLP